MKRVALVLSLVLLLGGCPSSQQFEDPGGSKCDRLWRKLEAARDAAQTYTREHADEPPSAEEERLHGEVDRAYERWQAAGCDQP